MTRPKNNNKKKEADNPWSLYRGDMGFTGWLNFLRSIWRTDQKLEGGPVLNLTQGMGSVLIQARLGKAAP